VSTHDAPQAVRPIVQAMRQMPEEHTWPAAQARPQAPQWVALVAVSTQAAPQRVWPAAQTHMPPEQMRPPPPQLLPHMPQLATSLPVSTQAVPQAVRPMEHEV